MNRIEWLQSAIATSSDRRKYLQCVYQSGLYSYASNGIQAHRTWRVKPTVEEVDKLFHHQQIPTVLNFDPEFKQLSQMARDVTIDDYSNDPELDLIELDGILFNKGPLQRSTLGLPCVMGICDQNGIPCLYGYHEYGTFIVACVRPHNRAKWRYTQEYQ